MNSSVDCIDVLKIDAEGADLQVLQGAEKTLAQRGVHFVFCEFFNDGRGASLPALFQFLEPRGFRFIATETVHVVKERDSVLVCANALFFRD